MDDLRVYLAERLERTYREGNWSGPGVVPALAGITVEEAHWRPAPDQHTIAELAWHIAYWCWFVAHRLDPETVTHPGDDWQPVERSEAAWATVLDEIDRAHAACDRAIREVAPERLDQPVRPESPWRMLDLVTDIATHDSYHAAQIFVLRRLYRAQRA